ncbi:unnamed protein product [Sympodiomycopsis kandeliae]
MSFSNTAKKLRQRLEVPKHESDGFEVTPLINHDIKPLEPARRTWGRSSFTFFWLVSNVNLSNWTAGSALISLGLNVGQSVTAIVLGNIMVAMTVVLTGAPGAKCIIPSFYKVDHSLAGGTLDTSTIIAFVIFSLAQLPLIYVKPEYYHKPFFFASLAISITCITLFIWSMATAGGAGALVHDASAVSGVIAVTGTKYRWAMVYAVTTVLGSICAGMLNQSDYTRYARKPRDPVWAQLISIPLGRCFCSLIGIVVTSCAAQWWPEKGLLWMPPDFLEQLQLTSGQGARAGVFFAALMFTISQWCMNSADNATPSGIDLASLLPKYVTIRRGAYFTALISVIIQPWQLLNGSSVYLTVMGSYSVFIAPLTGIIVSE